MTPQTRQRGARPSSRRLARPGAVTTAVVVAAALLTAPSASGTPGTAPAITPEPAAAPQSAVDLASLAEQERSGTVLTGQTVRFRQSPGGAVQILGVDDPVASGPDAVPNRLRTTASRTQDGAARVIAVPYGVENLLTDGSVDEDLFDAVALAAAPAAPAGSPIRVTVHYPTTSETVADPAAAAAANAAAAEALPGSRLARGGATATSATVLVEPADGQEFWEGATRPLDFAPDSPQAWAFADNPYAPRTLRQGVRALTLDGAAPADPATLHPEVTLTIRRHGPTDRNRWLEHDRAQFGILGQLTGTSGPAMLQSIAPDALASGCEDAQAQVCTTTFRVPRGTYDYESFMILGATTRGSAVWHQRTGLRVDDDMTIDLYADEASRARFVTPRPADTDFSVWSHVRVLPGGQEYATFGFASASTDLWFSPADDYQVGGSALRFTQIPREPGVRLSLAGTDLGAGYSDERHGNALERQEGCMFFCYPRHRFQDGTHRYRVADAGPGLPADYAGRDFRGKLALIQVASPTSTAGCQVEPAMLQTAKRAGAVGVIIDPTVHPSLEGSRVCGFPFPIAFWDYERARPIDPGLPFVDVSTAGAAALRADLADGRATVTITAASAPGYVYYLSKGFAGGIPDDLTVRLSARSLSTTTVSVNGSPNPDLPPESNVPQATFAPLAAGEWLTVAPRVDLVNGRNGPDVPRTITEYRDSTEVDTAISVDWVQVSDGRKAPTFGRKIEVPRAGERKTLTVGAALPTPGSVELSADAIDVMNRLAGRADSAKEPCTFCRDDAALWPTFSSVSGLEPSLPRQSLLSLSEPTVTVNGVEVAANPDGFSYPIPAEPAKVTVASEAREADGTVTERHAWAFGSVPAGSTTPRGRFCIAPLFGFDKPCTANPAVFLRYAPHVDADNTARSGRLQVMGIKAYHQEPGGPKISRVALSVSFDRGKTWQPARLRALGDGEYRALFSIPALSRTNGFVSVHAKATDAAGNSVEHTLMDALVLR